MGTPEQDKWLGVALNVIVGSAQQIGHAVSDVLPGSGANGAQAGPAKKAPHVTVIETPIVVHGKDPPPVVEIKKPVKVVIDDEAKKKFAAMDQSEIDITIAAKQTVATLHQDMHNTVGTWFRKEAIETIKSMSDGPGDLINGLASAFAAGITGVIGAAFPEVAVAMAALGGVEGGGQTVYVTGQKDEASDIKKQAETFLNDVATEAEKLIYEGRNKALDAIRPLVEALENDPQDFQRLIDHTDENVELLANKIASRWGTLADPTILDKLQARLHRVLILRI